MKTGHMVRRTAANLNGISVAYLIGLINTALANVNAFGVHLNGEQTGTLAAILNGSIVLTVHLSHRVGEAMVSGEAAAFSQAAVDAATPGNGEPVE